MSGSRKYYGGGKGYIRSLVLLKMSIRLPIGDVKKAVDI